MDSSYRFLTRWRVRATPAEVFAIIGDPLDYPRWWPSVYLNVRPNAAGGFRLLTKGWLPYRLGWTARTAEVTPPNRMVVAAEGDLEGRGIWSVVQDGIFTDVTFDWKISANKPLLKYLSPILRPIFEANHRWAMEQGEKSLALELQRLRAWDVAEMNAVAPPPGPASLLRAIWQPAGSAVPR